MKKYDFILLEVLYWHTPHLTIDIESLARILMSAGLKVAVVNYLQNDTYHQNKEYDVINIFPDKKFPDRSKIFSEKNKLLSFLRKIKIDLDMYKYFSDIYSRIKDLSDNFYFGTYTNETFPIFFLPFKNKKIFFWGYRPYFFTNPYFAFMTNPYTVFTSRYIRKIILKHENYRFFISNENIREEFLGGGMNKSRLIYRPERIIEKTPDMNFKELSQDFTLLTLGYIRKEKNLEFSIDTIRNLDIKFIIAGKSDSVYAGKIDEYLDLMKFKNIIRKKGFIPDDEYHGLFLLSHFLLIVDKEQKSTVSNGTFLEALLKGRPVIVPDIKPYNYYVNNYGIGLMFKPEDKQSLKETIEKARRLGTEHFKEALEKHQKDYLLKNVARKVFSQL